MIWNKCIVHILFAVAACLFWVAAALSGALYMLRYGSVSPPNSQAFVPSESMRQKQTAIYLFIGLVFFTAAIVFGYIDASYYWKSSQLWNAKVIFSLFIFIYYLVVLTMVLVLKFKKDSDRGWIVSLFAVAGAVFLLINLILSRYSQIHHYL